MIDDFTISTEALEFFSGQNEVLCICLFNINGSTALHCSKPSSGLTSHFNSSLPYIFHAPVFLPLSPHLLSSSHLLSATPTAGRAHHNLRPFSVAAASGRKHFLISFFIICIFILFLFLYKMSPSQRNGWLTSYAIFSVFLKSISLPPFIH